MINKFAPFVGILAVAGLAFLSSCKDDEETPVAGIQFETEEQEVTESDGTPNSFHPDYTRFDGVGTPIEVKIILDRPAAEEIVLSYDLDGSATDINPPDTNDEMPVNDFSISAGEGISNIDGDQLTIAKGASEAIIILTIYEDGSFEFDEDIQYETIELELDEVVSGPGKLGTDNLSHDVFVFEDDAVMLLQWKVDDSETLANVRTVDMDLFVWQNNRVEFSSALVNDSIPVEDYPFELLVIPGAWESGDMGISYNYFSGSSDDVDFAMFMFGNVNGEYYQWVEQAPHAPFSATYTTDNINDYVTTEVDPQVVQTMTKAGIDFNNFSAITVPASGSRMGSNMKISPEVSRQMLKKARGMTFNPSARPKLRGRELR